MRSDDSDSTEKLRGFVSTVVPLINMISFSDFFLKSLLWKYNKFIHDNNDNNNRNNIDNNDTSNENNNDYISDK